MANLSICVVDGRRRQPVVVCITSSVSTASMVILELRNPGWCACVSMLYWMLQEENDTWTKVEASLIFCRECTMDKKKIDEPECTMDEQDKGDTTHS
jgi:hypothetical protein